jgi:hypothetical protein
MKEFIHAFIWGMIFWLAIFWSIPGDPEPMKFNPMQCQTNVTELKRIEMDLTAQIFKLWDKQGKIITHTDFVVESMWQRANDAAKRIVSDNYVCKSK